MKEAVTRVLNTLTQEDFQGAFQKLLERYNKCIDVGGEYFEGDYSFLCLRLIKVSIPKKSGNLLNAPRIYQLFSFLDNSKAPEPIRIHCKKSTVKNSAKQQSRDR